MTAWVKLRLGLGAALLLAGVLAVLWPSLLLPNEPEKAYALYLGGHWFDVRWELSPGLGLVGLVLPWWR